MNCDCQYSQNNSKIASLTYLMDQNRCVNLRHFGHTKEVKNNRRSSESQLIEIEKFAKILKSVKGQNNFW